MFVCFVCLFNIHQIASPFPFIFCISEYSSPTAWTFFCLIAFFLKPTMLVFPMFCSNVTKLFLHKVYQKYLKRKIPEIIGHKNHWFLLRNLLIFKIQKLNLAWVSLLNRLQKLAKMLTVSIIVKKKDLTNFGCPTLKFYRCNGSILSYPRKLFEMESKWKTFIVSCFVLGTDYRGGGMD